MKSSKFKRILLFLGVFCVLTFIPINVLAVDGPSYTFGFETYLCEGDPDYTTINTCRNKYYNNELTAVDPGGEVAPGTTILLALTYDHNFIEVDNVNSPYYYLNAANTLNMVVNYNKNVLTPISYSYKVGRTTYSYTGVVSANNAVKEQPDGYYIIAMGRHVKEVKNQLMELGIKEDHIYVYQHWRYIWD